MKRLDRRVAALKKTDDKYRGRPFSWRDRRDCIRMTRSHLVNMGHRPPRIPHYRDPVGARTALRKAGHETLESLLDSLLPRIAPAEMVVGDIALMKGDGSFDAVVICVGKKVMGYHAAHLDRGPVNIIPHEFIGAWRA